MYEFYIIIIVQIVALFGKIKNTLHDRVARLTVLI